MTSTFTLTYFGMFIEIYFLFLTEILRKSALHSADICEK